MDIKLVVYYSEKLTICWYIIFNILKKSMFSDETTNVESKILEMYI